MKKLLMLLTASALILTACNDNDDDNNGGGGNGGGGNGSSNTVKVSRSDIQNLPSSVQIDQVRFMFYNEDTGREVVLATAEWKDGFELKLPETVTAANLENIEDYFSWEDDEDYEEYQDEIKISDKSANILPNTYFEVYNDGAYVGDLDYYGIHSNGNDKIWVDYCYVDKNVTIKVELENELGVYINLNLKKGWNRTADAEYKVAEPNDWLYSWTTNIPSDAKWHYYDGTYQGNSRAARSTNRR